MSAAEFYTETNINNNTHLNWRKWNKRCDYQIYSALACLMISQSSFLYSDSCLLFPNKYIFSVWTNKNISRKIKPKQPLLHHLNQSWGKGDGDPTHSFWSRQFLHFFAMHLQSSTNLLSRSCSLLTLWVALTQLVILVSVRFLECVISTQWDWGFQNGTWRI